MPKKKKKLAHVVLKALLDMLIEGIDLEEFVKDYAPSVVENVSKKIKGLDKEVQDRILDPLKEAIEKITGWNL